MELEIRARVRDIDTLQKAINTLSGITVAAQGVRELDTYLKHSKDEERQLIFRLRRGGPVATLTLKAKARIDTDILWHDIDIPLEKPDVLEDILIGNGYEYVVVIDKVRDSFRFKEYEINVDRIKDLGYFIEVAYETDAAIDAEQRKPELQALLQQLGCPLEDTVEKGYVALMLEKTV